MTNFKENFTWLRNRESKPTTKELSISTKIDQTTLSNFKTGRRKPTQYQLEALAKAFNLSNHNVFYLPHDEFRGHIEGVITKSNLTLLTFRSISESNKLRKDVYKKYAGQYILYYHGGYKSDSPVISSMVIIGGVTDEGIDIKIWCPVKNSSNEIYSYYEYSGLIFKCGEYLYMLAEQIDNKYEILSIIVRESKDPEIGLLSGMLLGIGVKWSVSAITSKPVVLERCRTQVPTFDVRKMPGSVCICEAGDISEDVLKIIAPEGITM